MKNKKLNYFAPPKDISSVKKIKLNKSGRLFSADHFLYSNFTELTISDLINLSFVAMPSQKIKNCVSEK